MTYTGKKSFLDRCPRCLEYRERGTVSGQRDVLGRIACKPCREETEVEEQNNGVAQGL